MTLSGEILLSRGVTRLSKSPAYETALWLVTVATTFQRRSRPSGAAMSHDFKVVEQTRHKKHSS